MKDSVPIVLIDRGSSPVEFDKTAILDVKRFTPLINNHLKALTYLARNLSSESITREVERSDRIMGAVNYGKTIGLRKRNPGSNIVVCSEIHRSYDTPENRLLVLILFSIMMYCDKYLRLEEDLVETTDRRFDPTMEELERIRSYVTTLLSGKTIRQILPLAIDSANNLDDLFNKMLKRIQQGKTPKYFVKVFSLYHKWKHYIMVSSKDEEIAKNVLQYHFMQLNDLNDLYECWIFCKILYAIAKTHNLKFRQIHSSRGLVDFRADDGSFHIIYQARYDSGWRDQDSTIVDVPDISIEFKNGTTVVIDAKNSRHKKDSMPYLDQMRLYMKTLNARYGIFVHCESEDPNLWKEITSETGSQKVIWTSVIPEPPDPFKHPEFRKNCCIS